MCNLGCYGCRHIGYAKSYIGQTSSCVGAAGERAASRKVEKYNFLRDTYIFVPLACETTGVWYAEGTDFLLGRRTSIITGDKHETAYALLVSMTVSGNTEGKRSLFLGYNCFPNYSTFSHFHLNLCLSHACCCLNDENININ